MATHVNFEKNCDYDKRTRIFQISNKGSLRIKSFKNGIAVIEAMMGCSITWFAEMISGCFDEESNFKSELFKAFNCDENTTFIGFRFDYLGETILITKENSDKSQIRDKFDSIANKETEKYRIEREAYIKTPEYRSEKAKELKKQIRRKQVEKEVLSLDETMTLEFKDDEAKVIWEKWVETNSNSDYGLGVVIYARRWAKYMQHLMKKHNKLVFEIADNASYESGVGSMSESMKLYAIEILSKCWKHGEELRKWHNGKFGYEDIDSVVNPSVLII